MGFAGARIALHQEAGSQQFLKVESRRGACARVSHLDRNGHLDSKSPCGEGLINRIASRRAPIAGRSVFYTAIRMPSVHRADWSPPGPRNARPGGRLRRNPPLDGNEEAGHGFADNPPDELWTLLYFKQEDWIASSQELLAMTG
jgi:hypothetical protein